MSMSVPKTGPSSSETAARAQAAAGHAPAGANGDASMPVHERVVSLADEGIGGAVSSGAGEARHRPDVAGNHALFNRDLSWLEFNRRVLSLAQDERTPLLERVRFLAIFSSNLDEFVMKRLGMLHRRITSGQTGPDLDGLAPGVLLTALRATIRDLQRQQSECFEKSIRPALASEGINLVEYASLAPEDKRWLRTWFRKNAFPVLTPLAVDPGHRFPFISNLSQSFGVLLREPGSSGEPLFARVKIPSVIPQYVRVPEDPSVTPESATTSAALGKGRFVTIGDIILANLDDLFPGMQLVEVMPFRVTRDSESASEVDDQDADNLLEMVEAQLKKRRFAAPVRLESGSRASRVMVRHLADELHLPADEIDERSGPLDFTTLGEIADLDRPELKWRMWQAVIPPRLADPNKNIFEVIRQGDLLVHHPFESFEASATRFIHDAARDPDVVAIKQTIYRTSKDSPFVASLIRAAESGKQVAVLVELRARFDEQSNVRLARMLEKAGAHVAYGVVGYKTHCKAALVIRRESTGLRPYAHLGTGNYHPRTAQIYTDLGLFTCDAAITDDLIELFNFLTGRSRLDTYETLLVAPINMKKRYIDLIQREVAIAGAYRRGASPVNGRIVAKMNALADSEIAEQLYAASQAGVQVTLFVRGFCCLRPGVAGLSENIRVVSVLGRFLEHSRIFHFGAGKADPLDGEWYISSADWMYRNLNNRVEASTPVYHREARTKLLRILQIMNADRRGAWQLQPDGSYVRLEPTPAEASSPESPAYAGTFDALMREARGA